MCVAVVALLPLLGCRDEAQREAKEPSRPHPQKADAALLAVEKDQVEPYTGAGGLGDSNLLRGRNVSYAHCSAYRSGAFARGILDGDVDLGWELPDSDTRGWVDGSLGLPVVVDKIVVRETGDHVRAYELRIYDGSEWRLIATGTTLNTKTFSLDPTPMAAVRMDITTTGGGGIAEIEAYNTTDPDSAFPEGPSSVVRKAFGQGRVALLLGSPLALAAQGKEFISPRERAIRPLADSGRYLPDVMSFLLQKAGGEGRWDAASEALKGECNGRTVSLGIPTQTLRDREQVVKTLVEFGKQAGLPCTVDPDFPLLLLFGDPLPVSERTAVLRETQELLGRGEGVLRRTRGTPNPPVADAVIKPSRTRIGKTLKWVGARTGGMPEGTNNAAWFSYYRPNAVRTWYGYSLFRNYVKTPEAAIASIEDFERLKADVRRAPEESGLILWDKLLASDQHRSMQHEYAVYGRFGAEIVNETGPKDWPDNWEDNFRNWLATYASTYYLARNYDVAVHQYGNEPDSRLKEYSDEVIALKLQLVADAITCAVEDVNRRYGKQLVPRYAAPVLASDPCSRIARVMMRNLRTDYRGRDLDRDLVQFFNRHRYGDRARQNALEVNKVQEMMLAESATGKAIPQIFTELNYSTGGNWGKPQITVTSDSPRVIHCMASIWGQMTATQDVYGIFLFKLNGDNSRWSNTVCQRFVRESDSEQAQLNRDRHRDTDIGYVTKNAELLRLFAEGFANEQDLLETEVRCGDLQYQAYTSYNADDGTYYLWTVQVNELADYTAELDLSGLEVTAGVPVVIKEVSAAKFGEVVFNGPLPASRRIAMIQPRASVWQVGIPRVQGVTVRNYRAVADATVRQGRDASENFGQAPALEVRRHSDSDRNRISFIRFAVDGTTKDIRRAFLRLHGRRVSDYAFDDSYTFRVYGLADDTWQESMLTADNAPAVCRTVSAMKPGAVTLSSPPVGHISFTNLGGFSEIDVTDFVREHADKELTFVLIRELKWPGEDTDFAGVELASREGNPDEAPRLQIVR